MKLIGAKKRKKTGSKAGRWGYYDPDKKRWCKFHETYAYDCADLHDPDTGDVIS
jgi:hypothetical protein